MQHWQQDFIQHFRLGPDSSRLRLVVARAPYAFRHFRVLAPADHG